MKHSNFSLSCYLYLCVFLLYSCSEQEKPKTSSSKKDDIPNKETAKVISEEKVDEVSVEPYAPEEIMKKEIPTGKVASPPGSPKATLNFLKSISSPSEKFKVNSNSENIFFTKRGSVITVPKECFVNGKGMYERGNISLEVKEVVQSEDYVMQGLPTASNGKMLISGGVMYMNATANGAQLKITDGKSIGVKFSAEKADKEMMLFDGKENQSGQVNWDAPRQMSSGEKKKPVVVNKTDFNWTIIKEKPTYYGKGGGTDKCTGIDFMVRMSAKRGTAEDKKEFSDRLKYVSAVSALARCYNFSNVGIESYLDYYLNAPGSNFNSIDTKVYDYLVKNVAGKATDFHVCMENNYMEDTLYGGMNYVIDQYKLYSLKKPWMPKDLNTYGINLNDKDAQDALVKKVRIGKEEAKDVMAYYKAEQEILASRAAAREKYNKTLRKETTIKEIGYSFQVNKLGWVNIDKFSNLANPIVSNVKIRIDSKVDSVDYATVGLAFKNLKSYLALSSDGNGIYSLGAMNLPANEPIKILSIIYVGEKIYYAEKDLKVSQVIDEKLNMRNLSMAELKEELKGLN